MKIKYLSHFFLVFVFGISAMQEEKGLLQGKKRSFECEDSSVFSGKDVGDIIFVPGSDTQFISGSHFGVAKLWDVNKKKALKSLGKIGCVKQFMPGSDKKYISILFNTIKLRSLDRESDLKTFKHGKKNSIKGDPVFVGPSKLLVIKNFGLLKLYDLITGKKSTVSNEDSPIRRPKFLPNNYKNFFACDRSDISLRSLDEKTSLRTFIGHKDMVRDIEFVENSEYQLLSSGNDGNVILWDWRKEKPVKVFHHPKVKIRCYDGFVYDDLFTDNTVYSLKCVPGSDKEFITSSQDVIRLWSTEKETPLKTFEGICKKALDNDELVVEEEGTQSPCCVYDISFVPGSKKRFVLKRIHSAQLWDLDEQDALYSIETGGTDFIRDCKFLPGSDKELLMAFEYDGLSLWNIKKAMTLKDMKQYYFNKIILKKEKEKREIEEMCLRESDFKEVEEVEPIPEEVEPIPYVPSWIYDYEGSDNVGDFEKYMNYQWI